MSKASTHGWKIKHLALPSENTSSFLHVSPTLLSCVVSSLLHQIQRINLSINWAKWLPRMISLPKGRWEGWYLTQTPVSSAVRQGQCTATLEELERMCLLHPHRQHGCFQLMTKGLLLFLIKTCLFWNSPVTNLGCYLRLGCYLLGWSPVKIEKAELMQQLGK